MTSLYQSHWSPAPVSGYQWGAHTSVKALYDCKLLADPYFFTQHTIHGCISWNVNAFVHILGFWGTFILLLPYLSYHKGYVAGTAATKCDVLFYYNATHEGYLFKIKLLK